MEVTTTQYKHSDLVKVNGRIDSSTAPQLAKTLDDITNVGRYRIILDLVDVEFMSSAGLRVMLLTYRESTAKNAKMVLVGMKPEIKSSMSSTGFLRFFTACDTREAGIEALR